MRVCAIFLAAVLALAPLGARAADLVVWWEKGFYPEEDRAVEELVEAYEQKTGKKVQLDLVPQWELRERLEGALAAKLPPDLALGGHCCLRTELWAATGLLADLSDVVLPIKVRFFPALLDHILLLNPQTGERVPYSVPLGQFGLYIHVWQSLLKRAGLTLADIPREWKAFWSFWCDRVQPAVRKALGRDDLWGMGLAMSTTASDTFEGIEQFMIANSAYLSNATLTLLDDPTFRRNLVTSLAEYTAPRRKDCVPPDAVMWRNPDNKKAFLEQRVVLTVNSSLSIPAALRTSRAEDYYENTATIGWPEGLDGRIYPCWSLLMKPSFSGRDGTLTAPRNFCASSWRRSGSAPGSRRRRADTCRRWSSCSARRSGSTPPTRTGCRQWSSSRSQAFRSGGRCACGCRSGTGSS
jgi:multiple sugar transport system substrate-binding protein